MQRPRHALGRSCVMMIFMASMVTLPTTTCAVEGPALSHEIVADQARSHPKGRRRVDANLLAPIPLRLARGLTVVHLGLDRTLNDASFERAAAADVKPTHTGTLAVGAHYYPHAMEGAPRFFIGATRFARPSFQSAGRPLASYELGADIADVDIPFAIAPSVHDRAALHVAARWRRAPGLAELEASLGYRLALASGPFVDLLAPRHLMVGWIDSRESWRIYAGARRSERPEAGDDGDEPVWILHRDESLFIGGRLPVWAPIFLTIEAGAMRRRALVHRRAGQRQSWRPYGVAAFAEVKVSVWLGSFEEG